MTTKTNSNRGRPIHEAFLDFRTETEYDRLINQFYKVCFALNYREIMALSRVLQVTPRTVQNWKYESTVPKWGIMQWVIRWGELGRPLVQWHNDRPGRPFYVADVETVEGKTKV